MSSGRIVCRKFTWRHFVAQDQAKDLLGQWVDVGDFKRLLEEQRGEVFAEQGRDQPVSQRGRSPRRPSLRSDRP